MSKIHCIGWRTEVVNLRGTGKVGQAESRFLMPTPYFVTLAR